MYVYAIHQQDDKCKYTTFVKLKEEDEKYLKMIVFMNRYNYPNYYNLYEKLVKYDKSFDVFIDAAPFEYDINIFKDAVIIDISKIKDYITNIYNYNKDIDIYISHKNDFGFNYDFDFIVKYNGELMYYNKDTAECYKFVKK